MSNKFLTAILDYLPKGWLWNYSGDDILYQFCSGLSIEFNRYNDALFLFYKNLDFRTYDEYLDSYLVDFDILPDKIVNKERKRYFVTEMFLDNKNFSELISGYLALTSLTVDGVYGKSIGFLFGANNDPNYDSSAVFGVSSFGALNTPNSDVDYIVVSGDQADVDEFQYILDRFSPAILNYQIILQ